LLPYGKCCSSARYSRFSVGKSLRRCFTTDNEPRPESKTAIGLSSNYKNTNKHNTQVMISKRIQK
jgi:hypothetical protein